mmetsp:Transcript_72915/g.110000  ORF Transcript_72915/g.110000 Transcript_72915/m.110000 type:complete len:237 (+) Transcript_72915:24-734(+)
MSKLDSDMLAEAIEKVLMFSRGEGEYEKKDRKTKAVRVVKAKKRNFVETIELQIALKNYDPARDKRFNGTVVLPDCPRPNLKVCVLGNQAHIEEASGLGLDAMSVDDLKKLNRNKKLVKKLAKKYDHFLASQSMIKQIPRLLGPGLNRAGKFPTVVLPGETLDKKAQDVRSTVKFAMKKVTCLNAAVGNVSMKPDEIERNIVTATNYLVSLLKKHWQNIKVLYIKSTMGPAQTIYF